MKMLFKKKFKLTLCYTLAALVWWPLFYFLLDGIGHLGDKIGG
ncbi:hypothetical protein Hsw_1530 [Hymenobacter swuensis DY53]|uniref:Uncharacterized protein n=1 Tax=Hymenobacter swuensis DY53 TaxID=1227739 RepID=W8F5U6_9BACT|nr:hypothetical protein Hsw_1530 [Hymenobacter swuensis DY53]